MQEKKLLKAKLIWASRFLDFTLGKAWTQSLSICYSLFLS